MRITKRQLRRIIREECQRELPIEIYTDDTIMSEGLLDFLGSLFGGLVGFFGGAAEDAESEASSAATGGDIDSRIASVAEEEDVEDVKSIEDLDLKKSDEHKTVFYKAYGPQTVEYMGKAVEALGDTSAVKDWTPKSDSEEDVKAWQDENGDASLGLWSAAGIMSGNASGYAIVGMPSGEGIQSEFKAVSKEANPGEGVKFILSASKAIKQIWDAAGEFDAGDAAAEVVSALDEVEAAANSVGEAIAASGKEQQKEWVDLRRWIGAQIIHEGRQDER